MRLSLGGFSRELDYLRCPLGRSLAVLSDFRSPLRPSTGHSVARRQCHSSVSASPARRVPESLPVPHRVRLPLSPRLTLIRLTLFRNPWACGAGVSTPVVVTYAYIFFSGRSSRPRGPPSAPSGMLPYRATHCRAQSFGGSLHARSSSTRHRSTSELLRTL